MSQRTLTKRLALVKPGMLLAGIDLAGEHNVGVVITDQAQRIARFSFAHTRAGYDYLYTRLERLVAQRSSSGVLIGMEPTNYYWKLLAADLEARRPAYTYRLINPYTLKKHREGDQLDRSKDDARDAFCIAELLRTGKFTETRLLHGAYAQLREYTTLYHSQKQLLDQTRNRLLAAVGQIFPELPQVFADLTGLTALALLRRHAAAAHIRELGCPEFIAGVRADFTGERLALSKLREAYTLAAQSVGLTESWPAYQLQVRMHQELLTHIVQQQANVQEALVETLLTLPEAPYLLSIPQMGPCIAALFLAEIGNPAHYSSAAQWVKLAGLQPVPNTSGHKTRSRTPMSHKGRGHLRTLTYWVVLGLIQSDPYFQAQYTRLRTRETHPLLKMEAIGALMNKLLHIAWALIHHHTFYDPAYQSRA